MGEGRKTYHDGADHDLTIDDDGLLFDGVHTQHGGLRQIQTAVFSLCTVQSVFPTLVAHIGVP